jgi:hypothetical protein
MRLSAARSWRNWTMTRDPVKSTISSGVAGLEGFRWQFFVFD